MGKVQIKQRIDPPDDDEDYNDFMDRCMEDGNDEEECQLVWDEETMSARAARLKEPQKKERTSEGTGFEFILSDDTPDRMGDIIEVDGWDTKNFERNPIALFNHNKDAPIGRWTNVRKQKKQLRATLELAHQGTSPRIDEIRSLIDQGILRAVSVGFLPKEFEDIEEDSKSKKGWFGPVRYLQQELLECSLVAVPANSNALRVVKSLGISEETLKIVFSDQGASMRSKEIASTSGKPVKLKEAKMAKKSIAEQISAYNATRVAKREKMAEIMADADEKGETLDDEQQQVYDELVEEVKKVDKHIERLQVLESMNKTNAVEVSGKSIDDAARSRNGNGSVVRVETRSQVPKGILYARFIIAKYYAFKNNVTPDDAARAFGYYDQTPELEAIIKAPVLVGTTTGTNWAKPLVEPTVMTSEFIDLLYPLTIIGRIPGLTRVPFNIKIPREITAASVNWVGEGKPKPVSAMAFDSITMGFTKVAGIVPVTEELFRFSNPAVETLVRDSLLKAVAKLTDFDFLDPAKAAVAGVSPASVTNGVTPIVASGTSADALRADIGALMAAYAAQNMNMAGLVLVMTSQEAIRISLMVNALGNPEFPGLGPMGGTLSGIPVITSENLKQTPVSGQPTTSMIVAINAPEVLLADDGAVSIDISREASLEMESAPVDPTASTVLVSLWQMNMVGIRAERMIHWLKRRSGAVQYLSGTKYGT